MENYVVSARKYRPLGFEEVVGQEHITTMLENAIKSNHLGQALLFCGPRGVGKTTCARILAKTINEFEKEAAIGVSDFNIFELDAASHNSVNDIRNLIDQVRYPPQTGKYKVYIIDEVHMLSTQAFNAFLKTLEEPPAYAIFILATTEKHKVIPTILSRCQIYDFNRIEVNDIVKQLEKVASSEKVNAEKEALHLIAQKADGALRDALSIYDLIATFSSDGDISYQDTIKNLHILDHDYYFKLVDDFLIQNMSGPLMLFDEILRNGFDGNNFLNGLQQHLRDLLISKDQKTVALLEVTDNLKARYSEQTANCSSSFLLSALNISNQFELGFKQSKNQRLHVEICLMKLAHLTSALSLSASDNEKKSAKSPKPIPTTSTIKPSSSDKPKDTPTILGKKKLKEKTENIASVLHKREIEFSEENLQNAWKAFSGQKNNGGDFKRLILNKLVKKGENHTVIISLSSQLEVSFLENFNTELVQFLRTELQNDYIVIRAEIVEMANSKKPYTNKDNFDYMVGQNPNLKGLKDRLGLDFD